MEESVSGFRVRGTWEDVVAHGERLTDALRELDVDADGLGEWDDWRPKAHERLEAEVSEKTVEQAVVEEGAGEAAGVAPTEDVQTAGETVAESMDVLEEDGPEDVYEKLVTALEHALRATDTAVRKGLRRAERTVFEEVMTEFTPYYFDNELVSANLRTTSRLEDGGEFVFEVNVNDDELKAAVGRRLGTREPDASSD